MNGPSRGTRRHLDGLHGETAVTQRADLAVLTRTADEASSIGSADVGAGKVICCIFFSEIASFA